MCFIRNIYKGKYFSVLGKRRKPTNLSLAPWDLFKAASNLVSQQKNAVVGITEGSREEVSSDLSLK